MSTFSHFRAVVGLWFKQLLCTHPHFTKGERTLYRMTGVNVEKDGTLEATCMQCVKCGKPAVEIHKVEYCSRPPRM